MGRHRLDPAHPAYWSAVILARHRARHPGHALTGTGEIPESHQDTPETETPRNPDPETEG